MKNIYLNENNVFSEKDFKNPPKLYAPTYNWVWNGALSHEETDKQLDEFERLGIKAICMVVEPKDFRPNSMPSLLTPDYLTEPYFEEYKYAVERAKEKGMYVWLYDEGGWPSGGACGQVMIKHPEYARRKLDVREKELKTGEVYNLTKDVLSAYVNDVLITDGFKAQAECKVVEYYEHIQLFEMKGIPEIPDVTRKEAVDCFIELTHEGYKPYLEEFFGDTILTVFSDESHGPVMPFREELEKAFLEENGYSIREYLPYLLKAGDMPEDAAKAKYSWLDLCSRFFCKNYLLNEKEWSNKHGLLFTGHFGGENSTYFGMDRAGYYNLMRALRCFDIPGVDAIWRQIYPTFTAGERDYSIKFNNGFFPRYASSAAAQVGSRRAVTESMGVYGAGASFDDMRYVFNYQAVRGINVFNVFGTFYSREGFHMMGEMPLFTEKHACYKDLPAFNSFAERLSYLASLGERISDVGYYMPVNDCFVDGGWIVDDNPKNVSKIYERIGNSLEDANVLFDIIDDDVLNASVKTASEGIISMGKGEYKTIVVPPCRYMPQKSIEVLNSFISSGGKVFIVSPQEISGICGAKYVADVKNIIPKVLEISGDTEKIRLGVRITETGMLYMLFNESNQEKSFKLETDKKLTRLYAETGKIISPRNYNVTLKSGEMAFFFDGVLEAETEKTYEKCIELKDFSFKRTNRFIIGDMNFISQDINEDEQPINLGDWSDIVGTGFSGSGIYKTTFLKPKDAGNILIDLGQVHYSCEVFVNGKSLGVIPMSPFICFIPEEILRGENLLEIRVSNTPANEYESTTSFDKWQPWQLTTYYPTQKLYHVDSISGGLYGPVKIYY